MGEDNTLREYAKNYLDLLKTEFKGLNLTRILDEEDFYNKQIMDSILPFEKNSELQSIFMNSTYIVDIGFGGGFPLLPLAEIFPDKTFLGFEGRRKKVEAVMTIAQKFKNHNVSCYHERLENIFFDLPKTIILFKAVGRVDKLLKMIETNQKNLWVFFYKGPNYDEDERQAGLKLDSWRASFEMDYKLTGANLRKIVGFKPTRVPRGTKKNLVKLSKIVKMDTQGKGE